MSAEHGNHGPIAQLLASIADPAVAVDAEGLITAWNDAAASRFSLAEDAVGARPDELLRRWRGGARHVALANADGGGLVVWSLDTDGLGPDEIALSKAEVVGRTSGSALHEINNQLNLGIGLGGLIPMEPGLPPDLLDMAKNLEAYGQHAHELAHGFLEFSRTRPPRATAFKVGPVVRQACDVLGHATINMQRRVTAPASLPEVDGDEADLRHAVFAVLVNALEAQGATWEPGAPGQRGRLIVTASHRDDVRGNRIRIAVEDGAPPVPEEERAELFTGAATRSTRDVLVARSLVGRLGGRLSYEAVADGNRIVIELPVAGTALPSSEGPSQGSAPVVLICDDDIFIRNLLVRMMERRGLQTVEARSGDDALALVAVQGFALVIVDGRLPEVRDGTLYQRLVASRPSLATRVIYMTGDPTDTHLEELAARDAIPLVPKPFDNDRLDEVIRAATES